MEEKAPAATKAHPAYLGLLGSQTLLLAVVGWFSIRTVDNVEAGVVDLVRGQNQLVKEQGEMRVEMAGLRATMDAWAKQEFVPRSLFEAAKAEYERRLSALEKKG